MSWWSEKYNRPLKDPILASYTLEELSYEYCLSNERFAAQKERDEEESDKIEEAKAKADEEWANQMEDEDEDGAEPAAPKYSNPMSNPDNIKWMQEEIERNKQEYGEDFGDDFDISF
jgi:hypothetical protein